MGAISPLGTGACQLFDRWRSGDCGIAGGVGRCPDDWLDALSPKEIRRLDRTTQMAIVAADEAARQAGWNRGLPSSSTRVACLIGNTMGGETTFEREFRVFESERPTISPFGVVAVMTDAPAAQICIRYGVQGYSTSLASACASGADAIALGAQLIRSGMIDAAFVGGVEASVTEFVQCGFRRMQALSRSGVCRPFDARRDGFILSEGAGVLCLETEASAAARGVSAVGSVMGFAATSDAFHICHPDPTASGAVLAIQGALADAQVSSDLVVYVNAHGTSTPINDRTETFALKRAFGEEKARGIPISSTKSAIGHTLAAAGALEAVCTILALNKRTAPPTLGLSERDPDCDLDYVPGAARALKCDAGAVAMSNSFGFGGHNVSLVLAGRDGAQAPTSA